MKMMYTTVVLTMKLMSEKYKKQMWLEGLQTSNEPGRGGLGDLGDRSGLTNWKIRAGWLTYINWADWAEYRTGRIGADWGGRGRMRQNTGLGGILDGADWAEGDGRGRLRGLGRTWRNRRNIGLSGLDGQIGTRKCRLTDLFVS